MTTDKIPERLAGVADVDLSGQTVLVTGSTSGIGRYAALSFGRLGAEVLVHGRDQAAGQEVLTDLEATAATDSEFFAADFASLDSVKEFAGAVENSVDELDILVNNAGGYFPNGGVTDDGIGYTFGVNHLAPFLLTAELLPAVNRAAGRIVTTASEAHRGASMDFDAIRQPDGTSGFTEYARSKLANILFTRELDRRLCEDESNVRANCLHPGAIPGSGFTRNLPTPIAGFFKLMEVFPDAISSRFINTPAEGAATVVYLGASPSVQEAGGQYFADCSKQTPSNAALDDKTARRLWTESEEMIGRPVEFFQ